MNRRTFICGAATAAGAVSVPLIIHGIHTHEIERKTVRLRLGVNRMLRVVALGDIHFDPLFEEAYLTEVVNSVTALDADIVVFTGDFFTTHSQRAKELAALLSHAKSRLGSFATLGNHDHWAGAEKITAALNDSGIRVLTNECVALPDEDDVYLTGLDSYWTGNPDPSVIARTPVTSRHIALVHEPDPFLHLTDPRIRLQISGHTHGGQVRAPYVGALVLPLWGKLFQNGLYERNGRRLYVNRGIGTIHPHVRYHCRPEITVFELT